MFVYYIQVFTECGSHTSKSLYAEVRNHTAVFSEFSLSLNSLKCTRSLTSHLAPSHHSQAHTQFITHCTSHSRRLNESASQRRGSRPSPGQDYQDSWKTAAAFGALLAPVSNCWHRASVVWQWRVPLNCAFHLYLLGRGTWIQCILPRKIMLIYFS